MKDDIKATFNKVVLTNKETTLYTKNNNKYVKSGKVNFGYTGLCKYNGTWWYVQNGKVNFKATTLCKYNGTWWYIQNGQINFKAVTLCKYGNNWFAVAGGKVAWGYTGNLKYEILLSSL